MRRLAKWALRLLFIVTLFAGGAGAALSTHAGQKALLALISGLTAKFDQKIVFGPFEGSLLSEGRLRRIGLHDANGEWLVVHDIVFSWEPLKLLGGLLRVRNVNIGRIDVLRKPGREEGATDETGGFWSMPMSVDRFDVSEISLNKSFLGVSARFRLVANAHFADTARGLDGTLRLDRLDVPDSKIVAALTYRPDDQHLTLHTDGSEPPGGLFARVAGLPDNIPVALSLKGDGPLDAWRGTVSLSASANPFVAGTMAINRAPDGLALSARIDGYLDAIVPQAWRELAGGKSVAEMSGTLTSVGVLVVDRLALQNDALRLSAAGRYDPARSDISGQAQLEISRADGRPVALPLGADAQASAKSLEVIVDLPRAISAEPATLKLEAGSIGTASGEIQKLELAGDLKRENGRMFDGSFAIRSAVGGLTHADDAMKDVIGDAAELTAKGHLAGAKRIDLHSLVLGVGSGTVEGKGRIEDGRFTGEVRARAKDVLPFSKLVGQHVAGSATINVSGSAALDATALHVDVKMESPSLSNFGKDGQQRAFGATKASFTLARKEEDALSVSDAMIVSEALKAEGRASINKTHLEVESRSEISDLAVFSSGMNGKVSISGRLRGPRTELNSMLRVEGQSVMVNGRELSDFLMDLNGTGPIEHHNLQVALDARIAGRKLSGRGGMTVSDGALLMESLSLDWGGLTMRGGARISASDAAGQFHLAHEDLSQLSVLAGLPLGGTASGDVELISSGGQPASRLSLRAKSATIAGVAVQGFEFAATVPLKEPLRFAQGNARFGSIEFGDNRAKNLSLDVAPDNGHLSIKISAGIDGGKVVAAGRLESGAETPSLTIENLQAQRNGKSLSLARPAVMHFAGDVISIAGMTLQSEGGRLDFSGKVSGQELDGYLKLVDMPAELLDMVAPQTGARGRLNGSARLSGSASSPVVVFESNWLQAGTDAQLKQGLPAIDLVASGSLRQGTLETQIRGSGREGLTLTSQVTLSGNSLNQLAGRIDGRAPLQIANALLAERGTRLSGEALVAGRLGGTLERPELDGDLRIEKASVRDAASGLTLDDIAGTGRITAGGLVISNLHGNGSKGGEVSAHGAVSWTEPKVRLDGLTIALDRLKIDDEQQVSGELDGSVILVGPMDALLASGRIELKRLDVIVPERMPKSIASLHLRHVNAPDRIAARETRDAGTVTRDDSSAIGLQISVHALDRISIRGRGLDALLGGELRLRGTSDVPIADGGFQLVRGRLSLLGRQLDFRRGNVAFTGALEPYLDLEAGTEADGVAITINVTGPASRPEFKLSSQPDLPDDEILARLVFNKALVKLTPLQIAQLASEIDKIGGLSSGPGLLDQLKSTVGIDRLDVATEKDGSTAVSAGSYVDDSTYVGVRQGLTAGSSRVMIDHDLTKHLKARGEIGADGNSKLGIGVEWDY